MATLTIGGCAPDEGTVQIELVPLTLAGDAFIAPAMPVGGKPGLFVFPTPGSEPGNLFRVTPKVNDPDCEPLMDDGPHYWLSGKGLEINALLGGKTQLWIRDKHPWSVSACENTMGGGGEFPDCWTELENAWGKLSGRKQEFKWETELLTAKKAVLQVSLSPFASSDDLLSPPWMLAKWDVGCVNCIFSIPFKDLAPPETAQKKSTADKVVQVLTWPFQQGAKGVESAVDAIGKLLGLGGGKEKDTPLKLGKPQVAQGTIGQSLVETGLLLPSPRDYYFRLVPLTESGEPAGGPSNTVIFHWTGEKNPYDDIKIVTCPPGQMLLSDGKCGTPPPKPKPFVIEIIEYNPLLPPLKAESCFIVTSNATALHVSNHYHGSDHGNHGFGLIHQYFEGDILCPPDPPESCGFTSFDAAVACIGEGLAALKEALNWVSEAWADAKAFAVNLAVSALGPLVPDTLCDDSCLKTAVTAGVDSALLAAGIPPSIPNLDQLMDQGIDYLAEQAVNQLPAEVTAAAELAGYDPKEMVKDAIKKGIAEMQAAFADSVDWLPEGVPVTPDGWRQPKVVVKVTRDGAVPFKCTGPLNLTVSSTVINDFQTPGIKQQVDSFNASLGKYEPKLVAGQGTQLYLGESVPVPCLSPGESVQVPILLHPADKWGTPVGYSGTYNKAMEAWWLWYHNGTATFTAMLGVSLGGDTLTTAADKSYP